MGKEIVFDYSKTAGFISEEEMKNMKSTVMGAKDVLTAKSRKRQKRFREIPMCFS